MKRPILMPTVLVVFLTVLFSLNSYGALENCRELLGSDYHNPEVKLAGYRLENPLYSHQEIEKMQKIFESLYEEGGKTLKPIGDNIYTYLITPALELPELKGWSLEDFLGRLELPTGDERLDFLNSMGKRCLEHFVDLATKLGQPYRPMSASFNYQLSPSSGEAWHQDNSPTFMHYLSGDTTSLRYELKEPPRVGDTLAMNAMYNNDGASIRVTAFHTVPAGQKGRLYCLGRLERGVRRDVTN